MKVNALFLCGMLACAAAAIVVANAEDTDGLHVTAATLQLRGEGGLLPFDHATSWLNSPPLTAADLRGKVVLVDFWTYSCINSLRQLPYLRAWANKYKAQGLVVIGVHAPEFGFEKDIDNVRRAARDLQVDYPVALDSDHFLWRAFHNEYWPALYFIDAQGRIRHHVFGEGEYEKSEVLIQQLLVEAGASGIVHEPALVDAGGVEAPAAPFSLASPENYVGYARTENFESRGGAVPNASHVYSAPAHLALNHWALAGDWTMQDEAVALNRPGGQIIYRFHARDLHLVMGPAVQGSAVRFRVLVDGHPPGAAHGVDVDDAGRGVVTQARLYQLIRQKKQVTDRQFEIEFLDPGVEAFAFTFG